MVKIDTTHKSSKAELSRIKKTASKNEQSSFSTSILHEDSIPEAKGISGLQPTQLLVSLQEMGEREIARYHGDKILDMLEEYKLALTMGSVDDEILKELHKYVTEHKLTVKDARINEALAEIELRASIELAKRGLI